MGLHEFLLDGVAAGKLSANEGVFPYLLEAMSRTGSWGYFKKLAADLGGGTGKAELLGYHAISAAELGESGGGSKAWTLALKEAKASQTADTLLRLHQIAMDTGKQDFAEKALIEAIRIGRGPLPLYTELRPLLVSLRQDERENTLLEICAIYLSFRRESDFAHAIRIPGVFQRTGGCSRGLIGFGTAG